MRISALKTYMCRDGIRPRVLVSIETDTGVIGWGECYNHGPDKALIPVLEFVFEQIRGEDPRRVEFLMLKLQQLARFPAGPLMLAAFSAIDHCLWDISAKAVGLPVYKLIGGEVRDRVRVYTGAYNFAKPQDAVAHMLKMNETHGFTAFKLSPFHTDLHAHPWGEVVESSISYIRHLKDNTPKGFELAFDAHAKIFEPQQAIQLGNAMAEFSPLFLEEPIRPENRKVWSRLGKELKCPLATGEMLYNRYEFLDLFTNGGCDIAQPDICVVGGLLEMRKIAVLAEAHYVTIAPHNPMGPLATAVNLHFCAAIPNFKILEYRLPHEAAYVTDPYLPIGGHLDLRPDRPGWGVEINEEELKRDGYVRWDRTLPVKPDGSYGYP